MSYLQFDVSLDLKSIFIHSYTDLTNADDDVRELLSKFVLQIKKMHRTPHPIENRVIWLVNSIT